MMKHLFKMNLPLFYTDRIPVLSEQFILNEETSKHVVQVLRMQPGEQLQLTDGKGNLWLTTIIEDHKKRTLVQIETNTFKSQQQHKVAIAISLLKNNSRFEWFLEKATELGVTEIIPLLCDRTEKENFRYERMKGILISAMLQSQQVWLPELWEPTAFKKLVAQKNYQQKFIAHCEEDSKQSITRSVDKDESAIILIGPAGDFSPEEIQLAKDHQFTPVTLGETRLRTETAGVVAATLLQLA